jgi:hypothetical protein
MVRMMGVVNLIHSNWGDFYPIDYRICAHKADGKSQNDHFSAMALNPRNDRQTGSIPPQIANLANRMYLYLESNQLTGMIPPAPGDLVGLWGLYLYNNQRSGEIPASFTNPMNPSTLDIGYNRLRAKMLRCTRQDCVSIFWILTRLIVHRETNHVKLMIF